MLTVLHPIRRGARGAIDYRGEIQGMPPLMDSLKYMDHLDVALVSAKKFREKKMGKLSLIVLQVVRMLHQRHIASTCVAFLSSNRLRGCLTLNGSASKYSLQCRSRGTLAFRWGESN